MRKRIQVVVTALCAVIMLSLIGYLILHLFHGASGNYPEPVRIENASQIYDRAVKNSQSHSDMDLLITGIQHTTANGQVNIEKVEQYITYNNMDADQMTAAVEERQTIGNHSHMVFETFADNTIYVDIDGSCFRAPSTAEAFRARYTPALPLNAENYNEISGYDTGSTYVITFRSPVAAEKWIGKDSIDLDETWGLAHINYNGTLAKSTYYVSYEENGVLIRRSFTVELDYNATAFEIPTDVSEYLPISHIDGPKELENACGHLLSAKNISAQTNDTIFFEAYGDKRLQQINITASNKEGLTARVDTVRTLENASHVGEISTYKHTQIFENAAYASSENGSDFQVDETINEEDMRSYYQSLLVSTVVLPEHITNVTESTTNGVRTITFSLDEIFADQIVSNACQTLYQKPDLMDTLESSHRLLALTAYIKIDAISGIPLSSGISYSGIHNINNFDYQLQYVIDQTYEITN